MNHKRLSQLNSGEKIKINEHSLTVCEKSSDCNINEKGELCDEVQEILLSDTQKDFLLFVPSDTSKEVTFFMLKNQSITEPFGTDRVEEKIRNITFLKK